ncbi:hypothetical protein D3C78_781940 [compost metagenome]
MIFLGIFIQKLDHLLNQSNAELIPQLISEYSSMMDAPGTQSSFDKIKGDVKMQMSIIMHLTTYRAQLGVSSQRYADCYNEMLAGFNNNSDDILDIEHLEKQYLNNYKLYYEPYMRDHSHVLENYLVNHILLTLFPKKNEQLFWDYMLMVLLFLLVRIHLIGISGHAKLLNDDIVVKVIQSFSRTTVHHSGYIQSLRDFFEENHFNTLAHAASMLSTK